MRTIFASGELEWLQMVSELDTELCAVSCETHIGWRDE